MASALERKLIVVTGKGGVGKTTVAAAIGLLAANRGLRTIVVEVGSSSADSSGAGQRLSTLLGHREALPHGAEVELRERLWGLSVDRDRVLAEWLRALGGRVPARVLTSSSSFQYLIAAAPGAREMLSMVKVWELAQGRRPHDRGTDTKRKSEDDYDLVVLDAPATGHALAMLRSPHMFTAIARVGPIARQARQVRELLEDPARAAYVAVTQPTEMAVSETLELGTGLGRELGRELHAIVVNGTLPRRFAGEELAQLATLGGEPANGRAVIGAATRAALAIEERARSQQRQIARLRRHHKADTTRTRRSNGRGADRAPRVLGVPFLFRSALDLDAVQLIADRLGRRL